MPARRPPRQTPPSSARPRLDGHPLASAPVSEALQSLGSSEAGLSQEEARARLRLHGPNSLPHPPPPTRLKLLVRQFQSPLIMILLIAAVVSLAMGETREALFIGAVLALNAIIGAWQERSAEQTARALQDLLRIRARVVRAGEDEEIDAEELVPGDLVRLESGSKVPADILLLSSRGLQIDESLVTGESIPVTRSALTAGETPAQGAIPVTRSALTAGETPAQGAIPQNLVLAGTIVARGRGKGLVIATGRSTWVGRLAQDVQGEVGASPPLVIRMERFARALGLTVLLLVTGLGSIGVAFGQPPLDMFGFAVALAISAVPEGLPVALTVALALAARRMGQRGVVVRRLHAVEGLGSCTMIASDKTGTLTCNQLTVRELRPRPGARFQLTGEGFEPTGQLMRSGRLATPGQAAEVLEMVQGAVLCNEGSLHREGEGWSWRGDPTDVALLSLGLKLDLGRVGLLEARPQIASLPFEPEIRFAATWHDGPRGPEVLVKGAPEQVLEMTGPDTDREAWMVEAEEMAARGLRVLALARGRESQDPGAPSDLHDLAFLGLAGLVDPLRPGTIEAVKACQGAGVEIAMVTGDHPVTALAIARELGLAQDANQVLTGAELEGLSPKEAAEALKRVRVFARTTPRQKLEIVEACQAAGHFVAVTGDGVNDAPALKKANVGVAMGEAGTDVAREAADLILSDDDFSSVVVGIEEGRVAYQNVRKVIYLLVSTGLAEVVLAVAAFGAGLPLPFLPSQLLWLNLVTNGVQDLALAFEGREGHELERPPRAAEERLFNPLMIQRTLLAGGVMAALGLFEYRSMLANGWTVEQARNGLLLLMVLFEIVHIGNCRSETRSAFRVPLTSNPLLLGSSILALGLHLLAMHTPVGAAFLGTSPLPLETWARLGLMSLTVLGIMELHKLGLTRWRRLAGR